MLPVPANHVQPKAMSLKQPAFPWSHLTGSQPI